MHTRLGLGPCARTISIQNKCNPSCMCSRGLDNKAAMYCLSHGTYGLLTFGAQTHSAHGLESFSSLWSNYSWSNQLIINCFFGEGGGGGGGGVLAYW